MESKVKWISEKILCFNNLLVWGMFCLKFTVWANCFTDPESPDADGDKTLRRHPRKTSEPEPGPGPAPDSGSHAEYIRCLTERLSQSYDFWIHHGLPAIHHVNTSEKLGDLFCGARGQNIWANLHNKDDAKAKRYWLLGEGEAASEVMVLAGSRHYSGNIMQSLAALQDFLQRRLTQPICCSGAGDK